MRPLVLEQVKSQRFVRAAARRLEQRQAQVQPELERLSLQVLVRLPEPMLRRAPGETRERLQARARVVIKPQARKRRRAAPGRAPAQGQAQFARAARTVAQARQ